MTAVAVLRQKTLGVFALFLNLALLCAGLILGVYVGILYERERESKAIHEHHTGQLQFINPIIDCGDSRALLGREPASFREQLMDVVQQEQDHHNAKAISVYFRDLSNGPWFGINEDEGFIPASLLKVPLLMAALKRAEDDPSLMKKKFTFSGEDLDQYESFKSREKAERGKTYSLDQLLYFMIVHSDNNAADLLLEDDQGVSFGKVFDDMGIQRVSSDGGDYHISVKTYGTFFRILFNASYLGKEMSNKALALLTRSDFRRGLGQPVPRNIPVAHKFGERVMGNERQFHDCGIVYYPSRPYLLCIMSRGDDFSKLVSSVEDVSAYVFSEVDRQMNEERQEHFNAGRP